MFRNSFYIIISALILPGFFYPSAVHAETVDEVLEAYSRNAREVHSWTMQALVDFQVLYTHPVTTDDRMEYENIFALAVEDPMYQNTKTLYCKTISSLEWKATIQPDAMEVEQTINSAKANFTGINPGLSKERVENLKTMDPLPNLTFDFTVPAVGSKTESNNSKVLMPAKLSNWHHFYSLWYPMPDEIGIPDDASKIVMTQGDDTLFVLMYTPVRLNSQLLEFVRYASRNPALQESDLVCTFMVAPESFNCKSFDIKLKDGDPKQSVFTITSFTEALAGTSVHIPTKVLMMTAVKNESAEGPTWSNEYFCRAQLKSFVKK